MNKKSNSWIVTRISNNEVIGEFFNYKNILKFNQEKVKIESAYDYLIRINKQQTTRK